ncbi:MAG: shikimate dehydrogenase [Sedimentisphaerales bacterium]|nr:shikimate dehydrogenase [Sedimentisphaerales bacterium]
MHRAKTLVVVSVAGQTPQAMVQTAELAVRNGADAIELRLDALNRLDRDQVQGLVRAVRQQVADRPIIATCRDKAEGGLSDYPVGDRIAAYQAALQAGVDWVDIELSNYIRPEVGQAIDLALGSRPNARLILSSHSWAGPFADIEQVYRQTIAACPHAVPKLVYMANHICDCLSGLDLLHRAKTDLIVFCMGQAGLITRLLAKKLGGLFTYATCQDQQPVAPGQLPVEQVKGLYRFGSTGPGTQVFGLVGDPVAHSIGPYVHNTCLAGMGIDGIYLPLLVTGGREGLFAFLEQFTARPWLDLKGLSVTLPHKQYALEFIDARSGQIEPLARRIGAVNTVVFTDEGIAGYNTDYIGAMDAIYQVIGRSGQGLVGWPVAVIGAGGVARAVVAGLCDAGAKVKIFNRTISKAQDLAKQFGCGYVPLDELGRYGARLLINCTSVGMEPYVDRSPVPSDVISPGMIVFDTVYNPIKTRLLQMAQGRGCQCIDGLWMYAHQAAAQLELFTGRRIDAGQIRQLALSRLQHS